MRRLAACVMALAAVLPAAASARTIHFHGREVRAPAGWPVYRLAAHPRMCVRLDRRAVYLGRPGANQRCPAGAIGRRRAILVAPTRGRGGAGAGVNARAGAAGARTSAAPLARLSASSDFTGLGFDACTAPSQRAMSAWASSPYRAVGVYIGGLNRGCSQPNLTASWVREQVAAGWRLIPTYVGLQSPTSSCGSCARLSGSAAASQGSAAAVDAVNRAQAVGIGPGSPIYFDMEAYARTTSATNATLTFLGSWTTQLHALGYESGIYSSSASGIADLVSRLGSGYAEPDDVWIANWNGSKSTSDPLVPANAWSDHQRIHQYLGGHNETYGGVTINIDNNYVEGATAGASPSSEDPKGHLDSVGSPQPGSVRVTGWAFDPSAPAETVAIRAYVGGKPVQQGVEPSELGTADLPRPDVGAAHRMAGPNHGFDVSFATLKNGREPVCVYAIGIGPGSDKLLGCRTIGVPVAVTLSHLKTNRGAVWVRVRCQWPGGTECPGQMLLRTQVRVRVATKRRGRRRIRTKVVRRAIARRPFKLSGERSHGFRIHLNKRGRLLTQGRRKVRAQLIVAIPGGRRVNGVTLRHRSS